MGLKLAEQISKDALCFSAGVHFCNEYIILIKFLSLIRAIISIIKINEFIRENRLKLRFGRLL